MEKTIKVNFAISTQGIDVPIRSAKIVKTIDEDDAARMVTAYRTVNPAYVMAKGTWYSIEDFQNYVDVFNKYANPKIGPRPNPNYIPPPTALDYKWQLASCLMLVRDENQDLRLTICLVPALTKAANPGDVIDFFDEKALDSEYYKRDFTILNNAFKTEKEISGAWFKSFVYDEGHLWP